MFIAANLLKLTAGGLFPTADEFDLAVRRYNQDQEKLVVLARRNTLRIQHVCLIQAREKSRTANINKGKNGITRERSLQLCSGE